MLKVTAILLITALTAAACTRSARPPSTRLTQKQFVAAMAELATAQPHQRAIILRKHRTTDAELRAYIKALSPHPHLLSTAFDSIQAQLDRERMEP